MPAEGAIESTLKIRLELLTQTEQRRALYLFGAAIFVVLFFAAVAPETFQEYGASLAVSDNSTTLRMTSLSARNQFIVTAVRFFKYDTTIGITQDIPFNSTVTLGGQVGPLKSSSVRVTCPIGSAACDWTVLDVQPFVKDGTYAYKMDLGNTSPTSSCSIITSATIRSVTVRNEFTDYELGFRYGFLSVTIILLALWLKQLRVIPWRRWMPEHKWVLLLLCMLVVFNNPFFALNFTEDGWLFVFVDALFQTSFMAYVLLFWLLILDSVASPVRRFEFGSFYLPKILLVMVFWFNAVAFLSWERVQEFYHPVDVPGDKQNEEGATGEITFFKFGMIVLGAIYVIRLLALVVRADAAASAAPFKRIRLAFLGRLTLLVVLFILAGFIVGAYNENFYQNAILVSYFSLANIYVYAIAYLFMPTREARESARRDVVRPSAIDEMRTFMDRDELFSDDEEAL